MAWVMRLRSKEITELPTLPKINKYPLKRDHFKKEMNPFSTNHEFSGGGILVFKGGLDLMIRYLD